MHISVYSWLSFNLLYLLMAETSAYSLIHERTRERTICCPSAVRHSSARRLLSVVRPSDRRPSAVRPTIRPISIYNWEHGGQGTVTPDWGDNPVPGSTFFAFGRLFIEKTARSGPPCDGL